MTIWFLTFGFGLYYYEEINRLIDCIDKKYNKDVRLIVLTDKLEKINSKSFVETIDIRKYSNKEYNTSCYSDFDFSVKKYLFEIAARRKFEKFIICDADTIFGEHCFINNIDLIFPKKNTINCQILQSFKKEKRNNKEFGKRVDFYQEFFNIELTDKELDSSGDDNILSFWVDFDKYNVFVENLHKLINIKNRYKLGTYAGILEEIYFSSIISKIPILHNGYMSNIIWGNHLPEEKRKKLLQTI